MQAKWFIMDHVRNALGYALSETFFQHAGLRSQVLDVTTDIDVAFFFATHGYRNGRYYRLPDDGSPRQIYRWRFPRRTWSLHSLNQYDYNTSPPVIPVAEILRLFKPCDTAAEFERSLEDYRKAIGWGPTFDLDSVRERRPFEIIRMPRELASSRAVSQGAAALAPDVVTPEAFFSRHTSTDPYWRAHIQNGLFVEDLAKNPTCERFEFDAGGVERQDWFGRLSAEVLFPAADPLTAVIRGWAKSLIAPLLAYGTIPIWTGAPIEDPKKLMEIMAKDFDEALFS
jgi:hypothetical protein